MYPAGCRDEIHFLNKTDSILILSHSNYQLEALDALDGHTIGQWPWKRSAAGNATLSHLNRNFIFGGYVNNEPVLITAQGYNLVNLGGL